MKFPRKISYWLCSAGTVVLMIVLGFNFIPIRSFVHTGGDSADAAPKHQERKKRLVPKDNGVEILYFQEDVATPEEVAAGKRALALWPTADRARRNALADDLVIANILLRKTKEKLIERLGPSEDSHPDRAASPEDGLFYDVTTDERWCFLNVEFENNKAVAAWLTVGY